MRLCNPSMIKKTLVWCCSPTQFEKYDAASNWNHHQNPQNNYGIQNWLLTTGWKLANKKSLWVAKTPRKTMKNLFLPTHRLPGTFRFFGLFRFGFLHQQCLLYLFGWARPERQHRIETPILRSGAMAVFPASMEATRQSCPQKTLPPWDL